MYSPYGDTLVDRVLPNNIFKDRFHNSFGKFIVLGDDDLIHLSNLATGCYSPLTGFMTEKEYRSVLTNTQLPSGLSWTLPIILHVPEHSKKDIVLNQSIALHNKNQCVVGVIIVRSVFQISIKEHAEIIFTTLDESHPGVRYFNSKAPHCIGGEVFMVKSAFPRLKYFNTPRNNRVWLTKKQFKTITAFSTRNICHVGHEHLHGIALELTDALGVAVITGAQVKGSFRSEVVFETYNYLIEMYYPANRVFLNNLRIPPIYAGPKEVFLQAVMLQNMGFTHFIVGRDHAGVGNYYPKYGSQRIFEKLTDLSINIVAISEPRYCKACEKVTTEKSCRHGGKDVTELNGRDVRRYFLENQYGKLSNYLRNDLQKFVVEMFENRTKSNVDNLKDDPVKRLFFN